MLDIVLKWLIPFICGSLVAFLTSLLIKFKAIKAGICCLLRAEIIRQYEKWSGLGYCPVYSKEALSRAYEAYHNLGGNDVATNLYKSTVSLPTEKEE
ncbi:MAG: hypothetical protein KBT06_05540 [Prevotellaceae bacterium]|nr:hypothetical protein [Candidatus Colivivens equi]